jgi:hypothetical protein
MIRNKRGRQQTWQVTDYSDKMQHCRVEIKTVFQATPVLAIAPTQAACNICTYCQFTD